MRRQPRRWAITGESWSGCQREYLRLQPRSIPICDGTANFWDGMATKRLKKSPQKGTKSTRVIIEQRRLRNSKEEWTPMMNNRYVLFVPFCG
jgi:hypothetical protein